MATRQRICRIRVLAENLPFLANSSTRQNGLFRKCVGLARLADIRQAVSRGLARLADIRQAVLRGLAKLADIRQAVLRGLAKLADIRQAVSRGLARLAKGKFGKFYANLSSLANLASVG
jgi:hypothetical protein